MGGTLDTDCSGANRSPCPQNCFFQMTLNQIGFEVLEVKEGIGVEKIIPPEPDEDKDEEKEKETDTLPLFFFSIRGGADNEFFLVRVIFHFQASEHFLIHPLKYRRKKGGCTTRYVIVRLSRVQEYLNLDLSRIPITSYTHTTSFRMPRALRHFAIHTVCPSYRLN